MKSIIRLVVPVLVVLMVGCSNFQDASFQEAEYVVQQQEDFGESVVHLRVESHALGVGIALDPWTEDMNTTKRFSSVTHIVIYNTKSEQKKLVLLNDNRPPEIVYVILLDKNEEVPKPE